MNWRHVPRRLTCSSWLIWRPVRRPGLNPPTIKGGASLRVNWTTIRAGWHCSGRGAASDVCGPQEVWKDHTWDGAAAAGLFKGFIMVHAQSIHIDSENIYPLWNGCGHNGPVFFKERESETAISSVITPDNLNLLHDRNNDWPWPCIWQSSVISFFYYICTCSKSTSKSMHCFQI